MDDGLHLYKPLDVLSTVTRSRFLYLSDNFVVCITYIVVVFRVLCKEIAVSVIYPV